MMQKNVGLIDSFCRISLGLCCLGRGISKRCTFSIIAGAMQSASGITGFCPIYHLLRLNTLSSTQTLNHLFK